MLLAAIVGNTTLRHALFQGEAIVGRGVLPLPRRGSPLPGGWAPPGGADTALLASVNPPRLEEALVELGRLCPHILVAGRDLPIPLANRYRDPAEVGVDRLLDALAASRIWPGQGAVVLDFGTALSVNVVSPAGEFLGGPIAGGVGALAAGLAQRTAQLPEVRPDRAQPAVLAASTREALASGIYWQVAGAAVLILERLSAELDFPFRVAATGGDAALFAPVVPGIELVDADLALKGLAAAYAHSRP